MLGLDQCDRTAYFSEEDYAWLIHEGWEEAIAADSATAEEPIEKGEVEERGGEKKKGSPTKDLAPASEYELKPKISLPEMPKFWASGTFDEGVGCGWAAPTSREQLKGKGLTA